MKNACEKLCAFQRPMSKTQSVFRCIWTNMSCCTSNESNLKSAIFAVFKTHSSSLSTMSKDSKKLWYPNSDGDEIQNVGWFNEYYWTNFLVNQLMKNIIVVLRCSFKNVNSIPFYASSRHWISVRPIKNNITLYATRSEDIHYYTYTRGQNFNHTSILLIDFIVDQ